MPFGLKHKKTMEVFSCELINIYDFKYHGVKIWNNHSTAVAEYASFLLEHGQDELWNWEVFELDENQVKIGNVKLNNNAAKRLFLTAEGKLQSR
ncbi:MAG: hypothetical protein WD469_04345 [Paenibacillaceae bacterium]